METLKQRLLGLCVPPLLLCLLDITLTLVGQSAQYWAGDYACVNEGSPTFHHLLRIHPAAFAAGILVWVLVFVSAIILLPNVLAFIASIVVTFAHAAGAATWLLFRFQFGYQACNGLFLASAIVVGVSVRWGWQALPPREYRLGAWPPFVRWGLATMLFGVAVYLGLWPRNPLSDEAVRNPNAPQVVEAVACSDGELDQLAGVPQLRYLCLAGAEITGDGLQRLERLPQLETLYLCGLQITDAELAPLKTLAELKSLHFDNVEISGAGLEHLRGLGKLQALSLCGSSVTDAWLEHVKGLSQLSSLGIRSTRVTGAGLVHIKGLSQLRNLNLTGTLVSDAALEHLKGLPQLEHLYLWHTRVTDAGLEHLTTMSHLRRLSLSRTNCTAEGGKKLRQALPKCWIEE